MAPLQGTFEVDFSKFQDAVTQADVSLQTFSDNGVKVAASLTKVENSLTGVKIVQQATIAAEAVARLGESGGITAGLLQLTDAELQKVGASAQEASAKLIAMGQAVPPGIQQIADAAAAASKNTASFASTASDALATVATGLGIAFSVGAVVDFAESILTGAAALEDLSRATGISTDSLQELAYVGKDFGLDLDTMGRGVEQLSAKLANGDKNATAAVQALGLSVKDLIAAGPQEAFLQVADAAGQVEDPMTKAGLASELFGGKLGKTLLPALGDLRSKMNDVPKDAIISQATIQSAHDFEVGLANLTTRLKSWTATAAMAVHDGWIVIGDAITNTYTLSAAERAEIDKVTASLNAQVAATKPAIDNTTLLNNELAALRKDALEPLSASQKTAIDELTAYGKSNADIAKLLKVSEAAVKSYADAQKAAAEQTKAYTAAVQALADKLSGADTAKKIKELNDAIAGLQKQGPLTGAELQRIGDAAAKLQEQGGTLSPMLADIAVRFNGLLPPVKDAKESLDDLGTRVYANTIPAIVAMNEQILILQSRLSPFPPVLADLGTKLEKGADGFAAAAKGITDTNAAMHKMTVEGLTDLAKGFQDLSKNAGTMFGGVLKDVSSLGETLTTSVKGGMKDFSDASTAFTKGNTLAGIASMAGGITNIASAALAAAQAVDQLWNHFFGSAGRNAVTQFAATFQGGFAGLHDQLDTLGASGEQLWITLTQGVGKNNPTQAAAAIKAVTDALAAQSAAANTSVQSLTAQITALGGAIDPALDPYIQKLQQAGTLTADNAKALQGLESGGVPTYQQLDALATKYNLSLAQMGPAFDESKVDAGFQTVIDDMDELQRGGVNVTAALTQVGTDGTTALSGLGTQVQTLIDQSIQYGVQVPANMKPAAQAMIDQGLLLDANGQKITDINSINFGETMQTSLDTLNDTLKTLIGTLTGNGPTSLLGSLTAIGNTTVSPTIKPNYDTSNLPPGMQTTQGTTQLAAADMAAGSGTYTAPAASGGTPVNITVNTNLDGKTVAQNQVQYIPGALTAAGR